MTPLDAPAWFGRGAVILTGQTPPDQLANAPLYTIESLDALKIDTLLPQLHQAWVERTPIVVALGISPALFLQPERTDAPVYDLTPTWYFALEWLRFIVWANNADCRHLAPPELLADHPAAPHPDQMAQLATDAPERPMWWHARYAKASQVARLSLPGEPGDVILHDGTAAWIDGGPRGLGPTAKDCPETIVHRQDTARGWWYPVGTSLSKDTKLSPDQANAVNMEHNAVRVIAPAGSGKTRVLTARIATLIHDRGVPPSSLLALVYNNRAAKELRERVGHSAVNIDTVHAWALKILRREHPQLRVMTEREVRQLLSQLVVVARKANVDPLRVWVDTMGYATSTMAHPSTVERDFQEDVPDFAHVYTAYREAIRANQYVDFNEMVYWAVELLIRDPALRAREQSIAQVVLVDEFQDLTPLYMTFVRLLAAPEYQIFGVGDDDQVIYGHTGATPDYLINIGTYVPGAVSAPLRTNYRCPQPVVEAASHILQCNANRVSKEIIATEGASAIPISYHVVPPEDEPLCTAKEIAKAIQAGTPVQDIAVLARIQVRLLPVMASLQRLGIACHSIFDESLLQRTGIQTVLAYMRIGLDPEHVSSRDVAMVLHKPLRPIPGSVKEYLPPVTSLDELAVLDVGLHDRQSVHWEDFIDDLDYIANLCAKGTTDTVVRAIIHDLDVGEVAYSLEADASPAGGSSSHIDDLEVLSQLARYSDKPADFYPYLQRLLRTPEPTEAAVTLSTIHRVKGLEWPVVFIVSPSEGVIPHRLSTTALDIEEERRVFHVAMTRASQALHVVYAHQGRSRFIDEMQGIRTGLPTAKDVAGGMSLVDGPGGAGGGAGVAGGPGGGAGGAGGPGGAGVGPDGKPLAGSAASRHLATQRIAQPGRTRTRTAVHLDANGVSRTVNVEVPLWVPVPAQPIMVHGTIPAVIIRALDEAVVVRTTYGSTMRIAYGKEVTHDGQRVILSRR